MSQVLSALLSMYFDLMLQKGVMNEYMFALLHHSLFDNFE